ncbi:hypothetical protein [Paraburkholderia tuberum]|uniref:hypothetical protein n=1 Tax=Paraburkholderia tuberum TaxID=157910 RepID=UPI0015904F94|nr:hypothetical protein [Paraburkholderia tuberum]
MLALLLRPNHDHEHADSSVGSSTAPQPLSMTDLNGERAAAMREKAAVEVRGIALLSGVIPVENSMVAANRTVDLRIGAGQ